MNEKQLKLIKMKIKCNTLQLHIYKVELNKHKIQKNIYINKLLNKQ